MDVSTVFLDWDGTLCDFKISEHNAMYAALRCSGIEPDENIFARYSEINDYYWRRFEAGEISKPEIMVLRFKQFFSEFGYSKDPELFNTLYLEKLSHEVHLIPGAESLCRALAGRYAVYITTNGYDKGQRMRIAASGLSGYFKDIFTSESIGAGKPDAEYWRGVFGRIEEKDPSRTVIVGDSLSSDMQSGINWGMHTCWINLHGAESGRPFDFEAHSLPEAEAFLCG